MDIAVDTEVHATAREADHSTSACFHSAADVYLRFSARLNDIINYKYRDDVTFLKMNAYVNVLTFGVRTRSISCCYSTSLS
jgi:hypothetical protein